MLNMSIVSTSIHSQSVKQLECHVTKLFQLMLNPDRMEIFERPVTICPFFYSLPSRDFLSRRHGRIPKVGCNVNGFFFLASLRNR